MKKFLLLFVTALSFSQCPITNYSPICDGGLPPASNTTGALPGPASNCLGSTPRRSFHPIQVNSTGNIQLTITQGNNPPLYNNIDVDFEAWGPFSTLTQALNCNTFSGLDGVPNTPSNLVACSYNGAAIETFTIPNAIAGQYYMVMITNFNGAAGFVQILGGTPSSPVTNQLSCDPVCGVTIKNFLGNELDIINCAPTPTSEVLTASSNNPGLTTPVYKWYLNNVLQPLLTTQSITVTQSGTWKVETTSPLCGNAVYDDEIFVQFNRPPSLTNIGTKIVNNSTNCTINLQALIPSIVGSVNVSNYTLTFHTSIIDANNDVNPITNLISYQPLFDRNIFIRLEVNGSPTCNRTQNIMTIDVQCLNDATATGNSICQTGTNTGTLTFVGTPGATVYFDVSPAALPADYSVILNASGNGTWTSPVLAATTTYDLTSITGGSPVTTNTLSSTATITVVTAPKAGTGTPKAFCSTDAPEDLFLSITGPKDTGGTWLPAMASGTGVYNPALDAPGTYTYSINLAGCVPSSTTVVVSENVEPNAGISGSTTVCETSTTAINLFSLLTGNPDTGGIWSLQSGSGGTVNLAAGQYTPAVGASTQIFRYDIIGTLPCSPVFSLVNVAVTSSPNAGTGNPKAFCSTDAPEDLFLSITGPKDTGGTWLPAMASGTGVYNPALDAPGTYTYSFNLVGCAPSSTTVTVSEQAQPNAGTNGTLTVCQGTTPTNAQLFAQLGGTPNAGGSWTNSGLVYTYTVTAIAPCTTNASATVTVTEQAQPNAGTNGTLIVCQGTTPTNAQLFAQLGGSPNTGGTWTNSGLVYTYTVTAIAPCTTNASATVTVTEQAQPNAGTNGTLTVCQGTIPTNAQLFAQLGGTPNAGGSWTNSGLVYTYTVTAIAPCTTNASATVTVTEQAQPNAGTNGTLTVCQGTTPTNAQLFAQLGGTPNTGGSWTNSGLVYTYTVTAIAPCSGTVTATVTVSEQAQPNAGTNGTLTVCQGTLPTNAQLFAQLGGTPNAGGLWTNSGLVYTYTVAAIAPCTTNASATVTVTEQAQPNAGIDGVLTICQGTTPTNAQLFAQLGGTPTAGGTWTNSGLVYTYTINAISPCSGSDTSTVTVIVQPQPNAGTNGTLTVCQGTIPTNAQLFAQLGGTPNAGGSWTNSGLVYTYTVAAISPCTTNATAIVTVTEQPQPIAGNDGTLLVCQGTTPTNAQLFSQLGGSPTAGGTWSNVGLVYTYTINAIAPCTGTDTAIVTVTEQAPPNAGTNGTLTVCQGTTPTNAQLFAQLGGTPNAGGTWSNSGLVYTYTVTAIAPCAGSDTATVTVTEEPTPQFTAQIADYTICNGDNLNIAALITANVSNPSATFEWLATFNNNINSSGLASAGGLGTIDQIINLLDPTQPSSLTIQVRPVLGSCRGNFQEIVITVNTTPVIQQVNIAPATICDNGTTVLTIVASPAGSVYDWEVSNVNGVVLSNGSTLGSSTSNVITMNLELMDEEVPGNLTFTITPRNGNCSGLPFTTGVINVNPIPGAPFFSPLPPICSGGTTAGLLGFSSFPALAGTEIVWEVVQEVNVTGASDGSGIAPAPILQTLTNTTNNQGYVIYSVKSRLNGCESSAVNITVFVNPKPKPDLTDGHICVDPAGNTFQSYFLSTQLSNANFRYRWFKLNTVTNLYEEIFGETNSTYEVTTEGTYKVEVIDVTYTTNCIETDIAVVGEEIPATGFTYVVTDAFTDNATITILVNPVGTGNLIYSLDGGAWQSSNVFTGVEAGEHEVLILDEEGCTNLSDKIFVIDYPKYFTPNGDGIHDTWNVVGLNQADAKLYIFDRYGKLIKQLVPVNGSPGWDGTYNGQPAPSTDYWFTIEFSENNQQKQFKSHFSLKR